MLKDKQLDVQYKIMILRRRNESRSLRIQILEAKLESLGCIRNIVENIIND